MKVTLLLIAVVFAASCSERVGSPGSVVTSDAVHGSRPEIEKSRIEARSHNDVAFASVAPKNPPKVKMLPESVDVGKKVRGEPASTEFEISNTGSGPLIIYDRIVPCTCSPIDITKNGEPYKFGSILAPGESVHVNVSLKTVQIAGKQDVLIRLETDDPSRPGFEQVPFGICTFTCKVDVQDFFQPKFTTIAVGNIRRGREHHVEKLVGATESRPFEVSKVVPSESSGVKLSFAKADPSGVSWRANIEIAKELPPGSITRKFEVFIKELTQPQSFYVSGFAHDGIMSEPTGGLYFSAPKEFGIAKQAVVFSTDGEKLNIDELKILKRKAGSSEFEECSENYVAAKCLDGSTDTTKQIGVSINKEMPAGAFFYMVEARTSVGGEARSVRIPVAGISRRD
ncbi:MAG: DUF1573 domain-containing protein [Planctomycetota bacterium]